VAYTFVSSEWVEAFVKEIQTRPDYKEGGKNWRYGPVMLIVNAKPEIGLDEDFRIYLDLHEGQCREGRVGKPEEAETVPFVIRGDYERWKSVVKNELEPVKGMMQGKLRLKGDLPTIVRNIEASKALVRCATYVDTVFMDESGRDD